MPIIDLLGKAGILFHDPVLAAKKVNAIWNDVQGWWLHSDRQNARLKFMDTFCRVGPDWQEEWIKAFKKILQEQETSSSKHSKINHGTYSLAK